MGVINHLSEFFCLVEIVLKGTHLLPCFDSPLGMDRLSLSSNILNFSNPLHVNKFELMSK